MLCRGTRRAIDEASRTSNLARVPQLGMPDEPSTQRADVRRHGTPADDVHEEQAHYGWNAARGAVVAEGDPEASAERPADRAPAEGELIPAAGTGRVDDAEGAGNPPQPAPGEAAERRLREGRPSFDARDLAASRVEEESERLAKARGARAERER